MFSFVCFSKRQNTAHTLVPLYNIYFIIKLLSDKISHLFYHIKIHSRNYCSINYADLILHEHENIYDALIAIQNIILSKSEPINGPFSTEEVLYEYLVLFQGNVSSNGILAPFEDLLFSSSESSDEINAIRKVIEGFSYYNCQETSKIIENVFTIVLNEINNINKDIESFHQYFLNNKKLNRQIATLEKRYYSLCDDNKNRIYNKIKECSNKFSILGEIKRQNDKIVGLLIFNTDFKQEFLMIK